MFALTAYSRLNLRPELFGYAVLAWQLRLLAPVLRDLPDGPRLSRKTLSALIGSQLLFVNLHSYFLLSLGIVGAMLLDTLSRFLGKPRPGPERCRALRRTSVDLALTGAGMTAVCLLNPWTWRLALLPVETLVYLWTHRIGAGPGGHPWSYIMEFRRTLADGFHGSVDG